MIAQALVGKVSGLRDAIAYSAVTLTEVCPRAWVSYQKEE